MKTRPNKTLISAIAILAMTWLATTGALIKYTLEHPSVPWHMWASSIIPPFSMSSALVAHAAVIHHHWLPAIALASGGCVGAILLYFGLRSSNSKQP